MFGIENSLEEIGGDASEQKIILRNLIITVSHKVYLEKKLRIVEKRQIKKPPIREAFLAAIRF